MTAEQRFREKIRVNPETQCFTGAELDELERLSKAATPGPWTQSPITGAGAVWISADGDPLLEPTHSWKRLFRVRIIDCMKALIPREDWTPVLGQDPRDHPFWKQKEADAEFIAAMRNAIPALLTAARRAIELEASLKEILGLIDDGYLIRDISKDHEPGYAMRQVEPVRKLCNAVRLTQGDPNDR